VLNETSKNTKELEYDEAVKVLKETFTIKPKELMKLAKKTNKKK
jgi:hypothetical protein